MKKSELLRQVEENLKMYQSFLRSLKKKHYCSKTKKAK